MKIIDWLFERKPKDTKPQIGLAGADKRALIWLPGRKEATESRVEWALKRAVLTGCSQLAVESWSKPIEDNDNVWICWVGLDIDEKFSNDMLLNGLGENKRYATIRKSSGGSGSHILFRLENSIRCLYSDANRIIKGITSHMVKYLDHVDIPVCSADKRLFWLIGGQCATLIKSDLFLEDYYTRPLLDEWDRPEKKSTEICSELAPDVAEWVYRLGIGETAKLNQKNPVNIRLIVEKLRSLGETVNTRSPMTSTAGTNGFIDLNPNYIGLWSFADGHTIWRYSSCEF